MVVGWDGVLLLKTKYRHQVLTSYLQLPSLKLGIGGGCGFDVEEVEPLFVRGTYDHLGDRVAGQLIYLLFSLKLINFLQFVSEDDALPLIH